MTSREAQRVAWWILILVAVAAVICTYLVSCKAEATIPVASPSAHDVLSPEMKAAIKLAVGTTQQQPTSQPIDVTQGASGRSVVINIPMNIVGGGGVVLAITALVVGGYCLTKLRTAKDAVLGLGKSVKRLGPGNQRDQLLSYADDFVPKGTAARKWLDAHLDKHKLHVKRQVHNNDPSE